MGRLWTAPPLPSANCDQENLTKWHEGEDMNALWQDLRYGVRTLLKNPGFTSIAVITLALGIGANTAIFSVVNALLFRSLPYKNPERLVTLWKTNPEIPGFEYCPATVAVFDDWRKQGESFESVSILDGQRYALTGVGRPERVAGVTTSASFFDLMGAEPILGRTYTEEEDAPGAERVVVISHALWQNRFGGDMEICGKTMRLDGTPHTIIGVIEHGFQFPRSTDLPSFFQLPSQTELWTPARLTPEQLANRGSHTKAVVARLKPGVSLEQAQAEISTIAIRNEQQFADEKGWGGRVLPMKEQLVGELRGTLLILLGAVGCVLLIACANVANLLLTRAANRQKEIAIRTALGASRMRIIRQLLTESLLLSFAGGAIALLLAAWGIDLLLNLSPASIPRKHEIGLDGTALMFTFVAALTTGFIFGLAPALQIQRSNVNVILKEGERGSTGGRSLLRSSLVAGQVALSLVLLIGAGLLIRSFARLTGADAGFNPQDVAAMSLSVSSSRYDFDPKQVRFFQDVLDKVRAIPGVVSAGAVSELPLGGGQELDAFSFEGQSPPGSPGEEPIAEFRFVDEGYFKTLQMPLVDGRGFDEHDNGESQRVAVINESLARVYFNNEQPVGRRIKAGSYGWDGPWTTVVGIVKDAKHTGLDVAAHPQIYFPYKQMVWGRLVIVARSTGNVASIFPAMREAAGEVDKEQPITSLRAMEDYLSESVSQRRFNAILLGAFAILALILAAVGLYGVISYAVLHRTHEIGIRIALGAERHDVFKLVIGQGMLLALIGVTVGLAAAFALTRLMSGMLYGISPTDPLTFAGIALLLIAVALLACYVPARRATRVDPMIALRCE
jgi:putative ABC transport system permease protein